MSNDLLLSSKRHILPILSHFFPNTVSAHQLSPISMKFSWVFLLMYRKPLGDLWVWPTNLHFSSTPDDSVVQTFI